MSYVYWKLASNKFQVGLQVTVIELQGTLLIKRPLKLTLRQALKQGVRVKQRIAEFVDVSLCTPTQSKLTMLLILQTDITIGVLKQLQVGSTMQALLHPSPLFRLPSSQYQDGGSYNPFPQVWHLTLPIRKRRHKIIITYPLVLLWRWELNFIIGYSQNISQNYLGKSISVGCTKTQQNNILLDRYNYKFKMSSTSIQFKDQGYTSPDFLTNLFKKPLYSSYNISAFETNSAAELKDHSLHPSTKENQCPTSFTSSFHQETNESPLKFKNISNSPKFYRSHTFIDDDAISKKKYKIFFKTIMNGHMNQEQINTIWENLERVMKDPFGFDSFLSQIREKREKEYSEEKQSNYEELKIQYIQKKYGKSVDKKMISQATTTRFLSHSKPPNLNDSSLDKELKIKASIRQSIGIMKKIIIKGEKYIRHK